MQSKPSAESSPSSAFPSSRQGRSMPASRVLQSPIAYETRLISIPNMPVQLSSSALAHEGADHQRVRDDDRSRRRRNVFCRSPMFSGHA